jgi:hypothetical protein
MEQFEVELPEGTTLEIRITFDQPALEYLLMPSVREKLPWSSTVQWVISNAHKQNMLHQNTAPKIHVVQYQFVLHVESHTHPPHALPDLQIAKIASTTTCSSSERRGPPEEGAPTYLKNE